MLPSTMETYKKGYNHFGKVREEARRVRSEKMTGQGLDTEPEMKEAAGSTQDTEKGKQQGEGLSGSKTKRRSVAEVILEQRELNDTRVQHKAESRLKYKKIADEAKLLGKMWCVQNESRQDQPTRMIA